MNEIINKCEILYKPYNTNNPKIYKCPECKGGELVPHSKEGEKIKYFTCNYSPYCKYKINDVLAVFKNILCPICNDYLV
ncbi:UNVERIFIED_CONTAM: hypothetical protein O8I53_09700 [Campylobacter lari]